MPRDIEYDFFVSYASADNREGWVDAVVNELVAEHARFTGGRELKFFLDRADIRHLSHWHAEIFNKGLARSRFFLAFLSPNYFASEVCRKEWRAWIEQEISLHILTGGAAPIYFVEVPGFLSKPMLPEHEVAAKVAELCGFPASERFATDLSPVVKEARRRQLVNLVLPLKNAGVKALQEADLKATLAKLAKHIEERVEETKRADASANRVSPYNAKFTGRLDELLELRTMLTDNRAGVIAGIHGLGGIGKTELAYTYAHAFAGVYPGGRFEVKCEGESSLRDAVTNTLSRYPEFRDQITDEERKQPEAHFAAVTRVLAQRLETLGSVLLVLDNVSDLKLLEAQQTDQLTVLGSKLHLLATTRLPAGKTVKCLTLGEMKPDDVLALLDKFRPFQTDEDRAAAESIVRQLGGFALAIELVAAKLAETPSASYAAVADGLGLADLDALAEDDEVVLRRHHEKRLSAVLGPTLAALKPEERRAMDFAALLPPDNVPLPWLKALVTADFPTLATATKWGDPWLVLVDRLTRLGLFTPVQEEATSTRQVKLHRLVQELLRREMAKELRERFQDAIDGLVISRDAELRKATNWVDAAWELDPLQELAKQWDGWEHQYRAWLLTLVASRRYGLAEYGQAEPPMRRALAVVETSHGPDHPEVAIRLSNLASLLQVTNRLADAELLFRRALAIDEQCFGSHHPSVATALNNLSALLHATNRLAEAEPLMRRALAIGEQCFGSHHPSVALRLNNLAQLLRTTNRMADAEPLMRRALAIDEQSYGPDHPNVATALNNLAQLLQTTNRMADAEPLMRRALAIDEQCFGSHHPDVARDLNNLALLLQATNLMADAEPIMWRAINIWETSLGPDHPNVASGLSNLALLLHATNRMADAEPLMRRALAIDEQSYGPDHPSVALRLNNLAQLLQTMNRMAEAEPLMRRALAIHEQCSGSHHPDVATALNNLSALLHATNRLAEAEPLTRRALAIHEQSYGPDHPSVANALNNLALLLTDINRLAEAEPLMWRVVRIMETSLGPDHPNVATALNNLAEMLRVTSRLAEAEPLYRRALAIHEQSYGPDHPSVANALNNLALLLQATTRMTEAEPLMRRAVAIWTGSQGLDHPNTRTGRKNLELLLAEIRGASGSPSSTA